MSNAKFMMIISLLFSILAHVAEFGDGFEIVCMLMFTFSWIWQIWNGGEPLFKDKGN